MINGENDFGGHESKKYRKVERDFGADRGRKKKKSKEVKRGQVKNSLERHGHGEKTPEEEVESVLRWVKKVDGESLEMAATKKYIEWLKERLTEKEFEFDKEKFGEFEKITASVGAGGAGRQTARNGRARKHLIAGIRAKAEEDRKSFPNEQLVMEKLERKIRKHLENWKTLLRHGDGFRVEVIEEEVLRRVIGLKK